MNGWALRRKALGSNRLGRGRQNLRVFDAPLFVVLDAFKRVARACAASLVGAYAGQGLRRRRHRRCRGDPRHAPLVRIHAGTPRPCRAPLLRVPLAPRVRAPAAERAPPL
eukprot:17888-Pleurochrysis_carterae.AAC.1